MFPHPTGSSALRASSTSTLLLRMHPGRKGQDSVQAGDTSQDRAEYGQACLSLSQSSAGPRLAPSLLVPTWKVTPMSWRQGRPNPVPSGSENALLEGQCGSKWHLSPLGFGLIPLKERIKHSSTECRTPGRRVHSSPAAHAVQGVCFAALKRLHCVVGLLFPLRASGLPCPIWEQVGREGARAWSLCSLTTGSLLA